MNTLFRTKKQKRMQRHLRIRARVAGTPTKPRVSVFRSLRGLLVQLIDDTTGKTLASVNTKIIKNEGEAGGRSAWIAHAYLLGKALSEQAKTLNITHVVFDRGGYAYHGRVRAVAEGLRDGGLVF